MKLIEIFNKLQEIQSKVDVMENEIAENIEGESELFNHMRDINNALSRALVYIELEAEHG